MVNTIGIDLDNERTDSSILCECLPASALRPIRYFFKNGRFGFASSPSSWKRRISYRRASMHSRIDSNSMQPLIRPSDGPFIFQLNGCVWAATQFLINLCNDVDDTIEQNWFSRSIHSVSVHETQDNRAPLVALTSPRSLLVRLSFI